MRQLRAPLPLVLAPPTPGWEWRYEACCGLPYVEERRELLRTSLATLRARGVDGDRVVADPTQSRPGRGAYVCSTRCLEDAIRRRAFQRAYRRPVVLDEDLPTSIGQ